MYVRMHSSMHVDMFVYVVYMQESVCVANNMHTCVCVYLNG